MTHDPFASVEVLQDGRTETMTCADFLQLSLPLRIRIIMERSVRFFDAEGRELDRARVLRELREATVERHR